MIRWILATGERLHRSWICKLARGGHLGYAEGVQKKILEDQMNMQISPWRSFWICKLAYFRTQPVKSVRADSEKISRAFPSILDTVYAN